MITVDSFEAIFYPTEDACRNGIIEDLDNGDNVEQFFDCLGYEFDAELNNNKKMVMM